MSNILYISLVDWFWIKQRPQHFAEILSKNNKITYLGIRSWKNNQDVVIAHSKNVDSTQKSCLSINPNIKVIRKRLIPKENVLKPIKYLNNLIMKSKLKNLEIKNNYDVVILTRPEQYDYIPDTFFNNKLFIYDCMDNYKSWPNCNRQNLKENERKIINISSSIVVSSEHLYNELLKYSEEIKDKLHIINNGVDTESFNVNNLKKGNNVDIFKNNNRRKVGYIGTISSWLDLDLIKNAAVKNKDVDFYIIGPVEKGTNVEKYKMENLIFTGSQPYFSVPNILEKIDVAVMPFKKIDLVRSVNPVKIYEYLSMGKPVIALRYKETLKFGNLIYTYGSEEEFEEILNRILSQKDDKRLINERISFAAKNNWEERVRQFESLFK